MTNCRRSILFPLAFLLVCDWADAAANSRPVLKIIFPPSNAVVNNGTLIEATITPAPSRQQFFTVRFSFSTNRKEFTEITGSAPDGLAPYGVLWNTQSLPGGRYFV